MTWCRRSLPNSGSPGKPRIYGSESFTVFCNVFRNVGGNTSTPQLSDAAFNNWYDAQVVAGKTNVSWAAAPDKYKLLMFQKYMAFNGIEPFEIYVDYRRNGAYPAIPLSYDPARIGNKLPVRALYPQAEYIKNKENVEAQGTIDIFTSKIWWMP